MTKRLAGWQVFFVNFSILSRLHISFKSSELENNMQFWIAYQIAGC